MTEIQLFYPVYGVCTVFPYILVVTVPAFYPTETCRPFNVLDTHPALAKVSDTFFHEKYSFCAQTFFPELKNNSFFNHNFI